MDTSSAIEYREIVDGEMVCGRSKRADWTIDDGTISRQHVRFTGGPDGDHVIDLGSTNGTLVNGRRISGSHPLTDGDEIRVGDRRVIYELLPPAHLAETPVPTSGSTWTSAEAPAFDPPSDSSSVPVPVAAPDGEPEVEPLGDTERWQSVKLIGRGGMGEVYRATDRDLAMDVAIKRLRRRGDGSEGILGRLHAREAAIARTIRHPNVVQVLEDGIHDGDPYMLLEWIDGPTFDRFLKSPKLQAGEKIECLRQVALGLEAAHRAGVVHADMKPANLLVSKPADPTTVENLGILEAPDDDFESEEEDLALEEELAARLGLSKTPDFDNVPFVGREGELELLVEIAAELRRSSDACRWVMLFGERGAGKGRLATEFIARLAADGTEVPVEISEEPTGPAEEFQGIWITLLPPLLPDIPELLAAYECEKMANRLHEIYLKPLLRGQTIRLVETLVQHPPSA
ncbi:MAG: FHA domain-containing protein, partial [Planctomycetota bacterium]